MRAPLLRMDDPEGLLDFPHDVPNTPARHTVPLTIGTRLDPRADLCDLRLRQAPLAPAAGTIHKALRAGAQHPVAQDLKLQALRPRCLRAGRAVHDQRDRAREACFASPPCFASACSSSAVCSVQVIGGAALISILRPS